MLAIASELDFKRKNIDNKIGYAQYGEDRPMAYYGIFRVTDVMPLFDRMISPALCISGLPVTKTLRTWTLDNKGSILIEPYAGSKRKEKGVS